MTHARLLAALVLTALIAATGFAQPGKSTPPKKPSGSAPKAGESAVTRNARPDLFETGVAAVVNREVITVAEVRDAIRVEVSGMPAPQRQQFFEHRLTTMIEDRVMDQATERLNLRLNEQQILSHIEREKERLGGEEAYRDHLMNQGLTHEQHVDAITQSSARHMYLSAFAGQTRGLGEFLRPEHSVNPTAREIRKYYEDHLTDEFSAVAKADIWYMAITIGSTAVRTDQGIVRGTREKALAKAKRIRDELQTGADFATLAKLHSPVTAADNGGHEGWQDKTSALNPLIMDYAFKAEIGKVSEPIEFRAGYLLVKVAGRKEAEIVPFADAQKSIRQKIRGERTKRARAAVAARIIREAYIHPVEYKLRLLADLEARRRGL